MYKSLIIQIMCQCDIKQIMMFPLKVTMEVLNVSTYIITKVIIF